MFAVRCYDTRLLAPTQGPEGACGSPAGPHWCFQGPLAMAPSRLVCRTKVFGHTRHVREGHGLLPSPFLLREQEADPDLHPTPARRLYC
jgi:hypothetical protein